MKKVCIVHGWDSHPQDAWFPWLKRELERRGCEVRVPAMPHPERPTIDDWVGTLRKTVPSPDRETFFIGHSIGCQTILRYLEKLPKGQKVGGVVFVAGWVSLTQEAVSNEESRSAAQPWLDASLDWERMNSHCDKFMTLFSDDDPFVPLSDAKIFKDKLHAKVRIEHHKRHYGIKGVLPEIMEVIDEILR